MARATATIRTARTMELTLRRRTGWSVAGSLSVPAAVRVPMAVPSPVEVPGPVVSGPSDPSSLRRSGVSFR